MKFLRGKYYSNGGSDEVFINVQSITSIWPTGKNFCTINYGAGESHSVEVKQEDLASLGIFVESWTEKEGLMS